MLLYWTNNPFNPVQVSKLCLRVCLFSTAFALGGFTSLPCAPTVSCSLQLHRAESGSLTCLIAFDSSLSSLVDQWSSALFIRNINVLHIPTGSATNPWAQCREWRFILLFTRDYSWLFIFFRWNILCEYGGRGIPCLFAKDRNLTCGY